MSDIMADLAYPMESQSTQGSICLEGMHNPLFLEGIVFLYFLCYNLSLNITESKNVSYRSR